MKDWCAVVATRNKALAEGKVRNARTVLEEAGCGKILTTGKVSGLRTGTGYKAVSLDDLTKQREVQVAEHDKAVNPEATRDESYHTFFGDGPSTWNRGEERHAGVNAENRTTEVSRGHSSEEVP